MGKEEYTMPAKKGPIITGRKLPGKPGEGRGKKRPMPIKPGPKGGKNPKLPYRSADPGFGPKKRNPGKGNPPVDKTLPRRYDPGFGPKKRPEPVKPKPAGGSIRDLLYRAKPGAVKKNSKSTMAKGFDKAKYEQMIQRGQISMMRRPDLDKGNKLQSMLQGYRSAPDNSKVTYSTRVKPKGPQSMLDVPYRIKKTTVKTGRGR